MLLWAVLAGAVVLALLCGVLGWMLLNLLRGLTLTSLPLRLAVSRLLRQPWSTLSQLSAFSLSFMLLALLLVLRGDLPRPLAAANAAGKSKLFSDQHCHRAGGSAEGFPS